MLSALRKKFKEQTEAIEYYTTNPLSPVLEHNIIILHGVSDNDAAEFMRNIDSHRRSVEQTPSLYRTTKHQRRVPPCGQRVRIEAQNRSANVDKWREYPP